MPNLPATIAAAAALLVGPALMLAPMAGGQAPRTTLHKAQAPVFTPSVNLTVEQRHVIKEIVREANPPPTSGNVAMTAGTVVPDDVELSPMPALVAQKVPQVKAHRFFVKDDRIALVDPKDRTIAEVIE